MKYQSYIVTTHSLILLIKLLQHSDGETVYARHLSGSSRRNFVEILQHTSVTNAFHNHFSCQRKLIEYRRGNFSNLKFQERLRQIKSEPLSSSRFFNDMITDTVEDA